MGFNPCPRCDGEGMIPGYNGVTEKIDDQACAWCGGKGHITNATAALMLESFHKTPARSKLIKHVFKEAAKLIKQRMKQYGNRKAK